MPIDGELCTERNFFSFRPTITTTTTMITTITTTTTTTSTISTMFLVNIFAYFVFL